MVRIFLLGAARILQERLRRFHFGVEYFHVLSGGAGAGWLATAKNAGWRI